MLYTEEQYQRCLKEAKNVSNIIKEISLKPLTTSILQELYEANDRFRQVFFIDVVNERNQI